MNIGIIGLGLMGGSFGRTLVKRTPHTVYGWDVNPAVMQKAELLRAYHEPLTENNARTLDMLVVSIYPRDFASAVASYLPLLPKGCYVTDFCGTKRTVVAAMRGFAETYPDLVFVGGHPMAGREFSGVEHATYTLFDRASMLLVPVNADIYALDSLKKFYLSVGFGAVHVTDWQYHDKMIAFTSQLCHIVSNAYIKNEAAESHDGFSAGSYRDLTRVARLNPTMWSQLMMENREELSAELGELIANLSAYKVALDEGDRDRLYALLDEGNRRKLAIDARSTKNG
ncbi:MAG: prephenate dehydrogenase [Clostridia bacterium]|nr:prephenate dehydrogenase [Clostridia bacterium]